MRDAAEILNCIAIKMGYTSAARYRSRAKFLFKDITIAGKRVLDVGCGRGAWALWAAIHDAAYVLGIEPDAAGSTSGAFSLFRQLIKQLNLGDKVFAEAKFLQEVQISGKPFDIIIMFNVINHIDEDAVTELLNNPAAVEKYVTVLSHLRNLMSTGGYVIVADCGRSNFWNSLGLKSPLAKMIEWHKHQNPNVWIGIFEQAGFETYDLRWSPLYPLRRLTCNRIVQYLTKSHFVLRFRAV
jgi:cyclopropane fatty-acyl-phospholipid synthase-like methyltransferase